MDKSYNLVIDTKRNFLNPIRGLNQGDNNAVLNISLIQNSIPYNLTGCTVRINYKLRNGQVLLQMGDVVDATSGKIKINILSKALIYVGEIKADISVFDSNNKKITTAPMSMFIDGSVYTNDYFESKDLDIIQNLYNAEDERIKAEKERKGHETTRCSNEDTRVNNENTRESNEKSRVENEKSRVAKWNELKLHAKSNNQVQDEEIEKITTLNERMKGEHAARITEYDDLKKTMLDENVSAKLLEKNKDTNERIDKNIDRINLLSESIKIPMENHIIVERNSVGLNPLKNINYISGDVLQPNEPAIIDTGNSKINYNSEFEIINNKGVKYKSVKDKTIDNGKIIDSLLEKINQLEDKVKTLEAKK